MRDDTVARNYAETLFALAQRHEGLEVYGNALDAVVGLLEAEPRFRLFLETPRIADAEKKAVLRKVLDGVVPRHFLDFLFVTIDKGRQRLLSKMRKHYHALVDEHMGREHVDVTVARPLDDETLAHVSSRLSQVLGREAVPHVHVRPEILGGMVVRTGDTMYDGSLRRRLEELRQRLLQAPVPSGGEA
ncbi:MAG: ATP synthase F1 subunit delta [Gemmatimonadota bacterium]